MLCSSLHFEIYLNKNIIILYVRLLVALNNRWLDLLEEIVVPSRLLFADKNQDSYDIEESMKLANLYNQITLKKIFFLEKGV